MDHAVRLISQYVTEEVARDIARQLVTLIAEDGPPPPLLQEMMEAVELVYPIDTEAEFGRDFVGEHVLQDMLTRRAGGRARAAALPEEVVEHIRDLVTSQWNATSEVVRLLAVPKIPAPRSVVLAIFTFYVLQYGPTRGPRVMRRLFAKVLRPRAFVSTLVASAMARAKGVEGKRERRAYFLRSLRAVATMVELTGLRKSTVAPRLTERIAAFTVLAIAGRIQDAFAAVEREPMGTMAAWYSRDVIVGMGLAMTKTSRRIWLLSLALVHIGIRTFRRVELPAEAFEDVAGMWERIGLSGGLGHGFGHRELAIASLLLVFFQDDDIGDLDFVFPLLSEYVSVFQEALEGGTGEEGPSQGKIGDMATLLRIAANHGPSRHLLDALNKLGEEISGGIPEGGEGGIGSTRTLRVSYDPRTQRGMILRLRKRLGKAFDVCFVPVGGRGANGDGLPAEIWKLVLLLNPTPDDAAKLFEMAAAAKPELRRVLHDPQRTLEAASYVSLLGVAHTRTRRERRLGLEENVAWRYRWVLGFLGQSERFRRLGITAGTLQKEAKENIRQHLREKGEFDAPAWPWWYLRLLSNRRIHIFLSHPASKDTDLFAASVVSLTRMVQPPGATVMRPETRVPEVRSDLGQGVRRIDIGSTHRYPPRSSIVRLWESGSAGADLVVIPMDALFSRALRLYEFWSRRKPFKPSDPEIMVSIAEPFPKERAVIHSAVWDRDGLRKEVAVTGMDKVFVWTAEGAVPDGITVDLRISDAFLSKSMVGLLEGFPHRAMRKEENYLAARTLILRRVHVDGRKLDLSRASLTLRKLTFGPSNLSSAPTMACPAPALVFLELSALRYETLSWTFDSGRCYPALTVLDLTGDIRIWEEPTVTAIAGLPRLTSVELNQFQGSAEDLRALYKAFTTMARTQTKRKEGEIVEVQVSFAKAGRWLKGELGMTTEEPGIIRFSQG